MKTSTKLILTGLISTLAFIVSVGATNPWPAFAVAFGAWCLFAWSFKSDSKKRKQEREKEELIDEFLKNFDRISRL